MVPIRTLDPIGAIGNYWAEKHKPTEDEIMLLCALADITAVAMENVRVYNELEDRVKERTTQLSALNKQLEAFSYSVSHDLRNPLHALSSLIYILNDKLDEPDKELIGMMSQSIQQMEVLIADMLSFFMTDKKELKKEVVSMKQIVMEICDTFKAEQPEKRIYIDIANMPEMNVDRSLMKQVWTNLLSNAIKYSGKKEEIIIKIDSKINTSEVVFSVKDNGAGFDMTQYDKLFGAFQRLHSYTEFEGTGVGLSIVEKIIERHGGKTWAESEADKGATFYFSLPV